MLVNNAWQRDYMMTWMKRSLKRQLLRIEKTRNVCDLKSLAKKIKKKGSVLEGTLSASGFVEQSKQLTSTKLKLYEQKELTVHIICAAAFS